MNPIYEPLAGASSIRLLDVDVNKKWHGRESIYSFRVVKLDGSAVPEYKAISYCWGDPKEVSKIKFRNGGSLPLTRTLTDLLVSISQEETKFTVWIDALCINQNDPDEKAAQVLLMGRIYSSAVRVLLWLGVSTSDSKAAFRFMHAKEKARLKLKPEQEDDFYEKENDMKGLQRLFLSLDRPWFRRVWVIQEITLKYKVMICCGSDRIDFQQFQDAVNRIWRFLDYDADHPAAAGLFCTSRLFAIREVFQQEGKVPYEMVLETAFHCQATDNRDKVFAFRGIADNTRPIPPPNYRLSEWSVFVDTAKALLCHGGSLDLLALCGSSRSEEVLVPDLPTWAPDLCQLAWEEPLVVADAGEWNAGGSLHTSPQVEPSETEPTILRLHVKMLGTVDRLCPLFNSYYVQQQQSAVRAIMDLRPAGFSEQEWPKKMLPTLTFGLNIDDEPDLEGYQEAYEEWFDWLRRARRDAEVDQISHNIFHRTIKTRINMWKAFMTGNDILCIGPPTIEEGDVLCTVPGCRLPLIFRPAGASAVGGSTWSLVSWCYADGLMFGEAKQWDRQCQEIRVR